MTENTPNRRTTRKNRAIIGWLLFILLLLAILAACSFFFFSTPKQQEQSITAIKERVEKTVASVGTSLKKIGNSLPTEKRAEKETKNLSDQPAETGLQQQELSAADSQQQDPEAVINTFFDHLDDTEYIKKFPLHNSSKEHFSKLIQKLLDNPPVVISETDDLFTLLKNTAHFFRVLGRDNVLLLKGILHQERGQIENIMQALYLLSENKEQLEKTLAIRSDDKALYDYATFFLDTVGGRLYLFRRDSSSRMVVTYYAIRILDNANDRHDSPHGTNIRPAINALIEEMENGGNSLRFRKQYLDKLYQLQEKYQQ